MTIEEYLQRGCSMCSISYKSGNEYYCYEGREDYDTCPIAVQCLKEINKE